MRKTLKVNASDNIIVALQDIKAGETIDFEGKKINILQDIPQKHKFAEKDFAVGDILMMYGVTIGKALKPIFEGERISTENVAHATNEVDVEKRQYTHNQQVIDVSSFEEKTFMGYHRNDGRVGTMNYWLVVPLVFCENRNINVMKEAMLRPLGYLAEREQYLDIQDLIHGYESGDDAEMLFSKNIFTYQIKKNRLFENLDGIKFLQHEMGCGGTRGDATVLCNLLAGYINHPNVAGATILSLGCQNAQIPDLQASIKKQNPNFDKPLYIFEQQSSVSEPDFIATAVKRTFVGLTEANKIKRQAAPLSKLIIGLKCGGSDGFSGISANPTLGHVSDLTVRLGGSTILAEFPELNGVEQELVNRCEQKDDAEKFVQLMEAFRHRAEAVGSGFDANPSPGNIRDGLITDAMKSAGAAKKGGNSNIVKVLDYAEQVYEGGLHLLCTPGNDVEATTGLAGSGANIILFTTGLGTPTGNAIAPTIKISTNNSLAKRMADIIDFNTGEIIEGGKSIADCGEELLEYIIKVASGEETPAAVAMGQDDFIPWKREVSL